MAMLRKMGAAIVILAAYTTNPASSFSQSSDLSQAVALFQQRRWAGCASAFEGVERSKPGVTDALLYRGKCLVNLAQFNDAAIALESYTMAHPQSEDAAYLIAYVRFRQNKPKESLQLYTDAGKLKPPTADDLKIVALDYVLLNDYADASRYLVIALNLDPSNLEARYHLGRVRYQQNRFDEAIAAFQEVLTHEPNNVKAEDGLGLSLEAKNEMNQAVSAYSKAIEFDKISSTHTEQPYLNLGTLLGKLGQAGNAISVLVKAKEINPKSSQVLYQLGKAYFDLSRLADAKAEVAEAARLNPDDGPTHYLLGRIYQRSGESELAAQQFKLTETLTRSAETQTGTMGVASGEPRK